MKIWLTRHGQTRLNKAHLMQGRTDEPLNETGIAQAKAMRQILINADSSLVFDAVYASPLDRAIETGAIIGGVSREDVLIDERLIETDFGRYEKSRYYALGVAMSLYWACPEIFPAPPSVESIASMVSRSQSFLKEIEQKDYENVLIACHGGIGRAISGYLNDAPRGITWRPKMHNCEVRVWESTGGRHRFLTSHTLS